MPRFEPRDPDYETKVRSSFALQTAMQTLGAVMGKVGPGEVEIEMPYRADLAQQHGFIHGGIVTAILDSACGYAAFSLTAPGIEVLTMEYKDNFLAPARGSGCWPGEKWSGPEQRSPSAKATCWPMTTARKNWSPPC